VSRRAVGQPQEGGSFRLRDFEISTKVGASPEAVWQHAISPAGVNREFRPLLRMTFPSNVSDFTAGWQPGQKLFRSWLLLGGVLPVEYDDLALVAVEPRRRFLERSSLLTQRMWEHERIIEPVAGGSRVTDRIRFAPRVPWLGPLFAFVFRSVFRLRHWNLRRTFGAAAA
jgi:ligand-binding SRPBCC domain-containing protein